MVCTIDFPLGNVTSMGMYMIITDNLSIVEMFFAGYILITFPQNSNSNIIIYLYFYNEK